jgi:hypothetical protein
MTVSLSPQRKSRYAEGNMDHVELAHKLWRYRIEEIVFGEYNVLWRHFRRRKLVIGHIGACDDRIWIFSSGFGGPNTNPSG